MQFNEVIDLTNNGSRTEDVQSNASFQSLMISPSVIAKIVSCGYRYPSPVQEKAIPAALSGLDLLVQAKSGTGKTLVFSIMAVENLNIQLALPQRLIVAPTREIAIQIKDTVKKLQPFGCRTTVLVGGTPLSVDKQNLIKGSHIVIGTTGRICQLIQEKFLNLENIELFVMDEADKMMDADFQKDINFIFSSIPNIHRQVAVFSATYPRNLDETLGNYMKNATLVRLNADDVQLIGIKQYACVVFGTSSVDNAVNIFKQVIYKQALVFCNTYLECETVCSKLKEAGLDAAYISAQISQSERQEAIDKLKFNIIKILVSTDLTARGVDASNVNLVINIGSANDPETYFHRIGRAARFGGQGASITLLEDGKSIAAFSSIVGQGGIKVKVLDLSRIPADLTSNLEYSKNCIDFLPNIKAGRMPKVAKRIPIAETTQIFGFPIDSLDKGANYDREEILSIRYDIPSISMAFKQRLCDLEVSKINFNNEVEVLAAQIATNSKRPVEEKEPEIKKYKFVPSRDKAKKKFYLRGELLAIRDSFNSDDWLNYAKSKFDMKKEPWNDLLVLPEQKTQQRFDNLVDSLLNNISVAPSNGAEEEPKQNNDVTEQPKQNDGNTSPQNIPLIVPQYVYDRNHMINIQKSWTSEKWLDYVKKKWNTDEEPFVLDQNMRCSVAEQIRAQREKEKQERIKVMKEREANQTDNQLYSSSRSFREVSIDVDSWEEFCNQLFAKFEDFQSSSAKPLGGVVPIRDTTTIWRERVEFYSKEVNNFEDRFAKEVKTAAGFYSNEETNTESQNAELDTVKEEFDNLHIDLNQYHTIGRCTMLDNALQSIKDEEIINSEEKNDNKKIKGEEKPIPQNTLNDENYNESLQLKIKQESPIPEQCIQEESLNEDQKQIFSSVYDRYFKLMRMYCHS